MENQGEYRPVLAEVAPAQGKGIAIQAQVDTPTMRQLMPAGFLPALCKRTGATNLSYLSQVVNLENTTSRHWPAVVALAKETNAVGYARWEAAHPVPA